MLSRERDLTEAQRAEMTAAALGVLTDARFAEVFGPGSRAEVSVAGTARGLPPGLAISGRIDRLVVLQDRVLVADFKTNRPSPERIEDADHAYLRQMAIYAAVLEDIFEGRRIEAAFEAQHLAGQRLAGGKGQAGEPEASGDQAATINP